VASVPADTTGVQAALLSRHFHPRPYFPIHTVLFLPFRNVLFRVENAVATGNDGSLGMNLRLGRGIFNFSIVREQLMSNTQWISIVLICLLCGLGGVLSAGDSTATTQPAQPKQQNAVLKSIEFVSTPSEKVKDEFVGTCRFVFYNHPSSYFYYYSNHKKKSLTFEFNDVEPGKDTIPSTKLAPFTGFTLEDFNVDVNKEVKGLQPEFHHGVKVSINTEWFPHLVVSENVDTISFSYTRTTDTTRFHSYGGKNHVIIYDVFWQTILSNFWPVIVVFIWGCVATILTVKH
jgi:hypothetical protein